MPSVIAKDSMVFRFKVKCPKCGYEAGLAFGPPPIPGILEQEVGCREGCGYLASLKDFVQCYTQAHPSPRLDILT